MVSRRGLLMLGAGVGATAVVPGAGRVAAQAPTGPAPARPAAGPHAAHAAHAAHGSPPATAPLTAAEPFTVPMTIPANLPPVASILDTDFYQLDQYAATAELVPGLRTPVLTYGGSYVGPTIRARKGRRAVVLHRNRLDMGTAVHLHGGHVPAASDGHPTDLIEPGGMKVYLYPNEQGAATLWYHDHAHHMESEHVYRGLHGFYLIEDPDERDLRLPAGPYDVPIMLTDARIGADGALVYELNDFRGRTTVLVNGRYQPYLPVAARRYRFRLLDASNLRFFELSVHGTDTTEPEQLVQIGSDGGLLPAPYSTDRVKLSPGERVEVVVDFSRFPVGSRVELRDAGDGAILRFHVTRPARDDSRIPAVLRELPPLPAPAVERDVRLYLSLTAGAFTIDGKAFDPERVDTVIKRGTSEIWRITNLDSQFGIPHNLHLHLVQFRVLDRDGKPVTGAEAGLKDTVTVGVNETVRVQATFADYLGRYVYHCHMLDHSAAGMMAQMEIVP